VTSQRVAELAEHAWAQRLEFEWYLRLRNGEPVVRLPSRSLDEAEEDAAFARGILTELGRVDPAELSDADRVTLEFLRDRMSAQAEAAELWWAAFPVTPYCAIELSLIPQMLLAPFRFAGAADVERYLGLLTDYAELVRVAGRKLDEQGARGWRIPRPALPGARATVVGVRDLVAAILPVAGDRCAGLPADAAARLLDRSARIVAEEVVPALEGVLAGLGDDYAAVAPDTVGLGQFPGGEAAYLRCVRFHLTVDEDPERLHRLGLDEVASLTERMRELRASLDFAGDEADFVQHLRLAGRLHAASVEDVAATLQRHVARIRPLVPEWFSVTPQARYGVERLDPVAEAGMSYGYYQPPTDDQPAGLYRFNGSGLESRSQLSAAALIFHELVPGHHFHLARQKENEALPMLRREALDLTVFNEGWAEYASGLAGEMGLYDDPYDRYGRLVHERFVAQRLVVDTGMNVLDWSLERAREFMKANTLEADAQVATETLRYSTDLPAQGLAYRYGYLRFMELRERAREALVNRFDIRAFHEAILSEGALPLAVLEGSVDRFIERARGTSGREEAHD
jgi:uncharacterized protein (DUF885 family)